MSNIRLIKRRIKSARNISQITRAMEMVAASKMKKAQETAVGGKPYARKIYEATFEFLSRTKTDPEAFPLLRKDKTSDKILIILISTNKGLCGGLNSSLFRTTNSWFPKEVAADFVTLGKKGESFVVRSGRKLLADFSNAPFLESIGAVSTLIAGSFSSGQYHQVYLVYNDFLSILRQQPNSKLILPIGEMAQKEEPLISHFSDFVIEPSLDQVITALLPHYLEVEIRAAILEAEASEHSARMMAMKSATDNAQQLMTLLTLEYNKVRQQMITYEIADIVTAKEAISF
jgi:F-type H+-transporting ATPase subunit gamma